MINPKYLNLAELAKVNQDSIVEFCCMERIPYLGIPIDPIFKHDDLSQLLEIIRKESQV